jgi:manganese transport protein
VFLGKDKTKPRFGALDILKYIGPGLLVTVGFIDPGNWASNLAAGSSYGYSLLWVITLSTIILIVLQHNAAHLGIATGLCLSEAANKHIRNPYSKIILSTGMLASVSTSMAEMLGAAIALNMLFGIPIIAGAILTLLFVVVMLFTNSYRIIEKWIIGFVAIIGLSFIYELSLVNIDWAAASISLVKPSFPEGSIIIIMSVLGAVVMPHNLFLHSEIIQSRQWNLKDDEQIKKQLKYEFVDTIVSMVAGWAINCAIILLAAATFFHKNIAVSELQDAKNLLEPLLGNNAGIVFAVALLFAGVASTITSGFAAGSIFAGMSNEPFDIKDKHSRFGVILSFLCALFIIVLIKDPFKALIFSQMALSIQLPITIFLQIYLTSSGKVMGKYKNTIFTKITLFTIAAIVSILNIYLFFTIFIK